MPEKRSTMPKNEYQLIKTGNKLVLDVKFTLDSEYAIINNWILSFNYSWGVKSQKQDSEPWFLYHHAFIKAPLKGTIVYYLINQVNQQINVWWMYVFFFNIGEVVVLWMAIDYALLISPLGRKRERKLQGKRKREKERIDI